MQHATFRDRTKGGKYALCNKIQPPATASPAKGEILFCLKMLTRTNNIFFKTEARGVAKRTTTHPDVLLFIRCVLSR